MHLIFLFANVIIMYGQQLKHESYIFVSIVYGVTTLNNVESKKFYVHAKKLRVSFQLDSPTRN